MVLNLNGGLFSSKLVKYGRFLDCYFDAVSERAADILTYEMLNFL